MVEHITKFFSKYLVTSIIPFQFLNQPGLDAGINPGMVLTPFPSIIG